MVVLAAGFGLVLIIWAPLAALAILGMVFYGYLHVPNPAVLKLLLATLALAAMLLAAFVFRLRPVTPALDVDEALRLLGDLPLLSRALKAPPLASLTVDRARGFRCTCLPRWYLFSPRLHLLTGLPDLLALPKAEWRAGVLRELAYWSSDTDRVGAWVLGQVHLWRFLARTSPLEGRGTPALLRPLALAFAPFLSRVAGPLMKARALWADRRAMILAGGDMAGGLWRLHLAEQHLEQVFWPRIDGLCADQPEPPADLYTRMEAFLLEEGPRAATPAARRRLMADRGTADTPSLLDRLRVLGWTEEPLPTADRPSLQDLAQGEPLMARLSAEWARSARPSWQSRHMELAQGARRRALLDKKAAEGPLSQEEAFDRAWWTERLGDPEAALIQLEALTTESPNHALSHFALGRLRLKHQDPRGLADLERAMRLDPACQPYAHPLVADHLAHAGDVEASSAHLVQAAEAEAQEQARDHALGTFDHEDLLLPHRFTAEQLSDLRSALHSDDLVKEAYLAERYFAREDQPPLLVLGLHLDVPWFRPPAPAWLHAQLERALGCFQLPDEGYLVILNADRTGLRKRLRALEGARIR